MLLSSHLLGDLERVCDYLIVLQVGQVQLLGATEELVATHKVLIGPHRPAGGIPGVASVVRESHTDRQSTLLVRTSGPIPNPSWKVHDLSLEDVVLAYLADTTAGILPGPVHIAQKVVE